MIRFGRGNPNYIQYSLSKGCPPGAGAKGPVHYPYPVNAHTEILFLPQGH